MRRATGPDDPTKVAVINRANFKCEACGRNPIGSLHHRNPRGMGGTRNPDTNLPCNLLAVCGTGTTGCHGWIESNRRKARDNGWLLKDHQDPATTRANIKDGRGRRVRVYLTADARYREVTPGWVAVQ